jgi:hypothetical protein
MNRPRRLGLLALLALFSAFQLLAPAPLLHAHCAILGVSAGGHGAASAGPAVTEGTVAPAAPLDDCLACSLSGLSAVFAARLAVRIPVPQGERSLLAESLSAPTPYLEDVRGRAPPAA